ncbi:MAG: hypothetical protein D6688_01345 [Alphaproteobacteria bacterium]|nr:MAG: hypothetical protein D6688_01345 [Alphaproteobacteria bacterium]
MNGSVYQWRQACPSARLQPLPRPSRQRFFFRPPHRPAPTSRCRCRQCPGMRRRSRRPRPGHPLPGCRRPAPRPTRRPFPVWTPASPTRAGPVPTGRAEEKGRRRADVRGACPI